MGRLIKVLYVAGRVNTRSGAFHSMLSNLLEFKNTNIDPIVLLHKHGDTEDELKRLGIRYYVIPYFGCTVPYDNPSFIKGCFKQLWNFIIEFVVDYIIRKEKIDLVHINVSSTSIGASSAIKENIPIIWHLREFLEEDVNLTYINPKRTIGLMKSSKCVIAISDAVAQYFRSKYQIENIVTVYNGIKCISENKPKLIDCNQDIFLTIVGRIVPGKCQLDAIKALVELKKRGFSNIFLNIVGDSGDSSYFSEIQSFIDSEGIRNNVNFISHQKNLNDIWKQTDVALVCSTKEGFGRVTAEFMLNGVPVVGADTGATPELLEPDLGYVYRYSDICDLSNKIEYAILHSNETKKMAEKAQDYAGKQFTSNVCASKIYNLYNDVLDNSRK